MKILFEEFYEQNDVLMKSKARKIWKACRFAAIEIVRKEAVRTKPGRSKNAIKRCAELLKREL